MYDYQTMIRGRTKFFILCFLVLLLNTRALAQERADKFLVIHLDAVSSVDFFKQLDNNELPNIAQLFSSGQIVQHGMSLFPGGTEIMLPRLKKGQDNSEGIVGWSYYNRATEEKVHNVQVFLEMFTQIAPQSREQFFLTLPGLYNLVGLSLLNLPRLWETQDVVEFYWFHTDFVGHLLGDKAHRNSLKRFDYYLGLAARAGVFEGANLLIYTDHGMTMKDVQSLHYKPLLAELLGEELFFTVYPNIYLTQPGKKEELARKLIAESSIDLTLVKLSEEKVQGYSQNGSSSISKKEDKFQYLVVGEDPFSYDQVGYAGEFLSRDEWLNLTKELLYPAVPPNIFTYFENDAAGDIVFILNAPQIPYSIQTQRGHHSGLRNTDLLVPLLFVGPAFAEFEVLEEFWLHEIFTKHFPMIDFSSKKIRERHKIQVSYPWSTELMLSPAYGWKIGLTLTEQRLEPSLEYNLYSSFLTRLWVGARYEEQKLNWQVRAEAFLGQLGLSWLKKGGQEGQLGFNLRLSEQMELNLAKNRFGLSVFF